MNGFLVENSWKNKSTKLLVSFHLSSHIFKYLFGKGIVIKSSYIFSQNEMNDATKELVSRANASKFY